MRKIIIILAFVFGFLAANSQSYTYIAQRYEWLAGMFKALGLPAGDSAQFQTGQRQRAGAVYYDSVGIDSGLYIYDGLAWQLQGGSTETASNGLSKIGNDIQFGGSIGSPGILTDNRVLDLNKKQLYLVKDYTPVASDSTPAFLYGTFIDSVYANNLPSTIIKTAATSMNRVFRIYGNFASQFKVGHAQTLKYEFGDTASILSNGGDFGGAVYNSLSIGYLPSQTSGRTAIRGGVVDFEAPFAALSNVIFSSSNASRHIRYRGWLSAHHTYLRMTNFPDTIDNFVFYNSLSFKEAAAKVLKSYVFYALGVESDSSWSLFSKLNVNRLYQEGPVTIGGGYTSSPYKFRLEGASYFSDSITLATSREVTDTTGMDVVLRKRSDGALVRIRADQLGGITGSGTSGYIPQWSGTNSLTNSAVIIDGNGAITRTSGGNSSYIWTNPAGLYTGITLETASGQGDILFIPTLSGKVITMIEGDTIKINAQSRTSAFDTTTYKPVFLKNRDVEQGYWADIPGGSGGTPALTQYRLAVGDASNLLSTGAAITANRALISDANGVPTHSTVTNTELGHVSGVTSAIQTQLDSKLSHTTANPALTGTTPSGSGVVPTEMFAIIDSDNTIADVNTAQNVFPSGYDEWTLQGSTTYEFSGSYYVTSGAASHSMGISFALAGGASITSIMYTSSGQIAGVTSTTAQTSQVVNTVSNTTMLPAAAATTQLVTFSGYIRMNAGGTVTPQLTFSAAPGGTNIVKANSFIKFTPIGTNTITNIGSVN